MPWWTHDITLPNDEYRQLAQTRQLSLTKPAGSLGELEVIAVNLAAMQSRSDPAIDNVHVAIFAADHGVAAQGVSAFPQEVTAEMIKNFASGGAAISVLAKQIGASFEIVNLGTKANVPEHPSIRDSIIAKGTQDFTVEAAMNRDQLGQALGVGSLVVEEALSNNIQMFVAGEMGIANTTSASAIAAALLKKPAKELVGPGTGISEDQLPYKAQVIDRALQLHDTNTPIDTLRCLGGFEIAALVGAYIRAAQLSLPVLIDGFICSVAALLAAKLNPKSRHWMIFAHKSAEPAHQSILHALDAQPVLNLNMRLGEGSGAALAINILRSACVLHNQMATFEQAGVSEKS